MLKLLTKAYDNKFLLRNVVSGSINGFRYCPNNFAGVQDKKIVHSLCREQNYLGGLQCLSWSDHLNDEWQGGNHFQTPWQRGEVQAQRLLGVNFWRLLAHGLLCIARHPCLSGPPAHIAIIVAFALVWEPRIKEGVEEVALREPWRGNRKMPPSQCSMKMLNKKREPLVVLFCNIVVLVILSWKI